MTLEASTDAQLIAAMLDGDEAAFRRFFETYFPRIYRFALPRLNHDAEACKEVVQATLSKAMRGLAGFRGEAALFSWLCQICRRQIVDHLRAHRKHQENLVLIDDTPGMREALESVAAPASVDPQHNYDADAARRIVQGLLDGLPERYGDVLEWKYIEGRSVEEIGTRLGVGVTAAQSLLARARSAFRDGLQTVFGSTASDVLAGLRR
ncbi:RNA polymerase sigma factor [Steroidobacter sp.]|uniref:RNA polymerase sigma factor n=1 Tax=Steroidobacter sp. TaxID=1978227 RepID=UPI001A49B069|nr:RNA polymerase sigma factor [Steroidobacter sp.]MBL8271955.1 RNA polymerase sigma factor [Steroidobacter sp.]